MSLYPSLEDMNVGRALDAQNRAQGQTAPNAIQSGTAAMAPMYPAHPPNNSTTPYPMVC